LTMDRLEKEGFTPLDYRYFCLQSRYRKQLVFSFETMKEAKNGLCKLKRKIASIIQNIQPEQKIDDSKILSYKEKFTAQISDDLNIPNAFTVLYDVLKDGELNNLEKKTLVEDFDKVFSLDLLKEEEVSHDLNEEEIQKFIEARNEARKAKDWALADEIRQKLLELNIDLIDSKEGTTWKAR